jgi:hypothetical protein
VALLFVVVTPSPRAQSNPRSRLARLFVVLSAPTLEETLRDEGVSAERSSLPLGVAFGTSMLGLIGVELFALQPIPISVPTRSKAAHIAAMTCLLLCMTQFSL